MPAETGTHTTQTEYNTTAEIKHKLTGTQKKIVDKALCLEERLLRLERIVLDPRANKTVF